MNLQTKAIFLDRDGVINIDKSYVYKIDEFEFSDGIFEVLKYFQSLGYILLVVTNQSGIGRGYYTQKDFLKLTSYMCNEFEKRDIKISKVYHSPSLPEKNLPCRKPNPGMLLEGEKDFNIDMKSSWMIGDKKSDIEAGLNAGISNTIYIGDGELEVAKFCVNSILDTMSIIK